jgi:hypothetical protein
MSRLELQSGGQLVVNAYTLAHLSDAAYDPNPAEHSSFAKTFFREAAPFADTETLTQGYVTGNVDHVVVALCGVRDMDDWYTSCSAVMREDVGGKVHRDFAEALDAVWRDVLRLVKSLRKKDQTLWVTGHSLGGALATLATARLVDEGLKPVTVTFGQPRVGDSGFAKAYTATHHRFVNNNDVVPTMPPRTIPGWLRPPSFYTHVGELKFFDENGRLISKPGQELGVMGRLGRLMGPLMSLENEARRLIIEGMRDNLLKSYLDCLKKNLPA